MNRESLKEKAAKRAVEYVKSGMRVGIGTGSTVKYVILELARKIKAGELENIVGVATSIESENLARENGIKTEDLDERKLDVAIDGADEIAPNLDLIKGAGGAFLREKLVELQANEFIVVADETKLVNHLGEKMPVPVEMVRFGFEATMKRLESFGKPVLRRKNNEIILTDNGNFIADLKFENGDPEKPAAELKQLSGVVETGLFLGMAKRAIVAFENEIKEFTR
ncbi:MAG: ribose 5-phosphate isomerase A [Pyrinomonadaceae bacterium]|nr:ribose 5-phosphate isomerase A [Pyrinomonadaceae bacterium]